MTSDDKVLFDGGFNKATAAIGRHETVVLEGESHEILTAPNLMTSASKDHDPSEITTAINSTNKVTIWGQDHKKLFVIVPHSGLTRTALEMESTAHVEGTKQPIEQVRECCIICRKQLERVCSEYPGKVHEPMLLPPSAHHYYTIVDILPDIKISAIANQKQTRNST